MSESALPLVCPLDVYHAEAPADHRLRTIVAAFAILYGLDWIATVPPTANLTAQIFGRASLGQLYGWIFFSHMCGAALAAFAGGYAHNVLGDYHLMFISAAALGFIAVSLALRIRPARETTATTAELPSPAAV